MLARQAGAGLPSLLTPRMQGHRRPAVPWPRPEALVVRNVAHRISPMHATITPAGARGRARGLSLIELMIGLAVVSILLAVAFPSYQASVRKGRRADAMNAINAVQQAQERWRSSNPAYGSLSNINVASTTPNGHYTMAVSTPSGSTSATAYLVTATAGGSQTADTQCNVLAAKVVDGTISYGSGSSSTVDWSDANRCWAK